MDNVQCCQSHFTIIRSLKESRQGSKWSPQCLIKAWALEAATQGSRRTIILLIKKGVPVGKQIWQQAN